jgi:hypothetical protein
MMAGPAAEADAPKTIMFDATFLKAHRTVSSLRVKKGGVGASSGAQKAGSTQSSTSSQTQKVGQSSSS